MGSNEPAMSTVQVCWPVNPLVVHTALASVLSEVGNVVTQCLFSGVARVEHFLQHAVTSSRDLPSINTQHQHVRQPLASWGHCSPEAPLGLTALAVMQRGSSLGCKGHSRGSLGLLSLIVLACVVPILDVSGAFTPPPLTRARPGVKEPSVYGAMRLMALFRCAAFPPQPGPLCGALLW